MTRRSADPLAGISRLVVDGSNLLHALARASGPLPAVAVTGRLRALVPAGVTVTLVLDGVPASGAAERRLTSGVEVRYSGRRSGDHLVTELVAAAPDEALVVTDDRELGVRVRAVGARTVRTAWLAERLGRQRLQAPLGGRPRAPFAGPGDAGQNGGAGGRPGRRAAMIGAGWPGGVSPPEPEEDGPRWKPGRGATRKTGNPKRRRRGA